MNENSDLIERKFIYVTKTRYHTPKYPYRLAVEERKEELIICHQARDREDKEKWTITHSIGIKKQDLSKILEALE